MRFLPFILLLFLFSCKNPVPKDFVRHTINLKNHLGKLTVYLPEDFDTSYTWIDHSDNRCDDTYKFRFADKKYSLLRETGFLYDKRPDSLFQFTITQAADSACGITKGKVGDSLLNETIEKTLLCDPGNFPYLKKVCNISGRDFIVLAGRKTSSKMKLKEVYLSAYTMVNRQDVALNYSCYREDTTGFVKRMEKSLNTLVIK